MAEPAIETKDTAKKMTLGGVGKSLLGGAKKAGSLVKKLFSKEPTSELVVNEKTTPVEYLGEIFKMMKVMDEDKKLNHEMANNHLEEEEHKKDLVYISEVTTYINNLSLVVPEDKRVVLNEIIVKLNEIQNRFHSKE